MRHDFAKLRQIPILNVAQALGMDLVRTGMDTFNMREEKKVSSLTIFPKTNTFYRFSGKTGGGVHGGSVIDLVMHMRDCSLREAAEFLSARFQ